MMLLVASPFVADSLAQIPRSEGELPLRMMSFTETSQLLQKELMNDYSYRVTRHAREFGMGLAEVLVALS